VESLGAQRPEKIFETAKAARGQTGQLVRTPSPRPGDIAGEAGNEVEVEVRDGLASRLACVEPDVVPVGLKFGVEGGLYDVD
jgi:hypothetical protein